MTEQRIAFVLPNISGGGAARVAAILCGEWIKVGHEVHLVTYEEPGAVAVYPLDRRIIRHQIGLSVSPSGLGGFVINNARRVFRLRRTLRLIQPTAVVAFLAETSMCAIVAGRGLRIPVLISERTHPAHHMTSRIKMALRHRLYPLATRLCVQTQDIEAWFKTHIGIDASVIPNPVYFPNNESFGAERRSRSSRRRAVSLGRLEPVKGHDVLIDAFAMIATEVPEWDIVIYGEGPCRKALEDQIGRLGLDQRVILAGTTRAPQEVLSASDLYVHPALYEGFPNAVLEALAAGLCVVATDCAGATSDILKNGKYGFLVPSSRDARALADAMRRTMQDEILRLQYATKARDAVRIYEPATIAACWINEIKKYHHNTSTPI